MREGRGGSARKILGRGGGAGARQRSLQRGSRQVQKDAAEMQESAPTSLTRGAARRREGTKRITVDLPRDEHKFLRDYAYDADADGMRVVRALLMELRDDPELSERVLQRLLEPDR